jgi:hypothetical protein
MILVFHVFDCFGWVGQLPEWQAFQYLHESEKSSQQNLRGSTIKGSNPSKWCITGKTPLKKGKKSHFLPE